MMISSISSSTRAHKESGLISKESVIMEEKSLDDEVKKSNLGHFGGISRTFGASVRRTRKATLNRSNGKYLNENHHPSKQDTFLKNSSSYTGVKTSSQSSLHSLHQTLIGNAHLYVLGEKTQIKGMKQQPQNRILFVPIDFVEPKQVRHSYKNFLKAILPAEQVGSTSQSSKSTPTASNTAENCETYLKNVQDSGWLDQVSQLLQIAGAIVDVMDIQAASVMIAVDDGRDVTPQLTSLAQLLSDPYYRTVEGFRVLVQKEWLSFGHRFSHRNRFNDVESSGFTPIFLQFLDAVYQIHEQFPMSFEFNVTFIETIAFHSCSNRFTTFLLDSNYQRLEAGILFDSQQSPYSSGDVICRDEHVVPAVVQPRPADHLRSLWDYIDRAHKRSPIFLNCFYLPKDPTVSKVLRPVNVSSRLKVWPYYTRETLSDGPFYDNLLGELTTGTSHNEQEAAETSEVWGGATARRVVNRCYDNVADVQPSSIKMLLQQIERLQIELGIGSSDSWISSWNDFNNRSIQDPISEDLIIARNEVQNLHKKTTIELLHKKTAIFEDVDTETQQDSTSEEVAITSQPTSLDDEEEGFGTATLQFRTNPIETRTFEGYLFKQGVYMRAWKKRFFVLDIAKHQLRQYESENDNNCKTIIDLKDLESVQISDPVSGAPKETTSKSFICLKMMKRTYNFIALSDESAQEWVEKLQATL